MADTQSDRVRLVRVLVRDRRVVVTTDEMAKAIIILSSALETRLPKASASHRLRF